MAPVMKLAQIRSIILNDRTGMTVDSTDLPYKYDLKRDFLRMLFDTRSL